LVEEGDMDIIRESRLVEGVEFSLFFERRAVPGCGYSFPCDEAGRVDESEMTPASRANLAACREDAKCEFKAPVIDRREWHYREPAVGRCGCGREVELGHFTNTCDGCGADYNGSGQRLAPRAQWGEETGEPWYECY
jgi:hypothetical protein